jgi:UDPglucose--hexose-1-phosphate uridylyltransferase
MEECTMRVQSNEMRKDYLLNRWVVIATQRKRRPTDFVKKVEKRKLDACPLCPGNEHMTPPAVLVYLPSEKGIRKEKDLNGFRHKNWLVRCVLNLYPAFTPPQKGKSAKVEKNFVFKEANGHHEVLVESPRHDEHPGVARVSQLVHVVNAYIDRLSELSGKSYVKYVSIFRNHRLEAGASLSHAHTQIITTPSIPRTVKEELEASRKVWRKDHECAFCEILVKEKESLRFVWESQNFMAFAPWASVHPFEFWIFPKEHQSSLLDMSKTQVRHFAEALRKCLGGLNLLLEDPPYNFGFHQLVDETYDYYHWHLEVYPKLAIWAGFEKSTGTFINVVSPEDAAESLKESIQKEA